MLALALALSASVCGGCADFVAALQNRRHRLLTVMVVSQCTGLVVMVVIVWAAGSTLGGGRDALLGIVAGVSIGVAVGCLYRGLAVGTMAIVAPISACGAIVPVVVSLARGDEPGTLPLAGIALAFAGIVTATRQHGDTEDSQPRGVGLAVASAVAFGVFYVALDAAAEAEPLGTVLVGRIALVGLLLVAALVTRTSMTVPRADLPPLLAVGLLDLGAVVLYALATREGLLSVVSVLASFAPLITIVLAHVLLRERISRVQSVGVGATLCGIMLIAIG
jgi:drug/metabolite transporter (DMT)-like permease